jgi:hypothetical protein
MVPVLSETGSLMAYLLYPDPQGILQEYYSCKYYPRAISVLSQSYLRAFSMNKNAFSWAGQLSIHSQQKLKKMATTNSNGVTADRIKNDSAFERTRENAAEFARAGKAAKLLRTIFRDVTINAKDRITQARLVKVMSRIIAADPVNERGARTVNNGDMLQLQGFNYNVKAGIADSLFVRCPVNFNRASGEVTVTIPAFVPRNMVQQAKGTTHFRIVAAATAVNFDTEQYEYAMQGTAELPYDSDPTQAITLTMALPANSTDTVVAVLGIEYYQRVNSRSYALKSGDHNATSIVLVDKVS